jgi:class 3 adenylate cyclase/tetratricopeptide (TPR) repeat protein
MLTRLRSRPAQHRSGRLDFEKVERKLATVLFVDLVDSTGLVSRSDPEVVRRRVTAFFERVSRVVTTHGGIVEKFAGDSVLAAFGIPVAHEDDAERATHAAFAILAEVAALDLEARLGIESGEVVFDDAESTFATGEAVNLAARLQGEAAPGEILVGAGTHRLLGGAIASEAVGPLLLKGMDVPVAAWRILSDSSGGDVPQAPAAPLVGREAELELLDNMLRRAIRDRRAALFTIYGEPGVGKSRLAREFVAQVEGATVLGGRCLPYGEGVTYWPLAEMVKTAAGISDFDAFGEAREKLLASCEDEVVADLLGLATGVLEAVERERSRQEIAWAAREWAETLALAQPLVLVFEDIHWAEEPLLELVEHLATWVREAPLLIICLARPELLDVRPGWGGGRLRATAIELEPLSRIDAEQLVEALDSELGPELRDALLAKTEGNPLYVEETIRMIREEGSDTAGTRIPDTLQALIAARIDRLPPGEKTALQRAAVLGRVFWIDALASVSPQLAPIDPLLDDLLQRDFLARELRTTLAGEQALRFKHGLIRDVAYAGLPKAERAGLHRNFAGWLRDRTGDELVEIRAYHLDHAAALLEELDGAAPADLATEAAQTLEGAGRRSLARQGNRVARRLLQRAVELEPTLERRYWSAAAAWRLGDLPAVSVEMQRVADEAEEAGDPRILGSALTALAEVALMRDADLPRSRELADRALEALADGPPAARFDALSVRASIGRWIGDLDDTESYAREALELAQAAGLKHLEASAAHELSGIHKIRLELDAAEPLVERALSLAEESGNMVARAAALHSTGCLRMLRGDLDSAEEHLREALDLFSEAGAAWSVARVHNSFGWLEKARGDLRAAERSFREAVRILAPLGDRGTLCESQRGLAQILAEEGKLEEAEQVALQSLETVGEHDASSLATTRMALGLVRARQGRDEEAEALLRDALAIVEGSDFRHVEAETLANLAQFFRERGRSDEADALTARIGDVAPELELDGVLSSVGGAVILSAAHTA